MAGSEHIQFPGPTTLFRDQRLPEEATPAGYAALIDAYGLRAPLPRRLFAIGAHHRIVEEDGWRLLTPRHAPVASLEGHLTFALKYEGLDLCVLARLFEQVASESIELMVRETPTGSYARRVWFLYEWLTQRRLNLQDAAQGRYVDVVDPEIQYGSEGERSRRHRVNNNLPGSPAFCPLVFRTEGLDDFSAMNLADKARAVIDDIPRDLVARTAAFLLLKDSRSSYAIEGEQPPQDRLQRWGRAIGQAGSRPLDRAELLRLQKLVIGDARFVRLGLRDEDGFIGEHDRLSRMPIPEHISARPQDLDSLIDGVLDFASGPAGELDPVVAAAVLAFGFVFIHPFQDGNGRVHRYLIHHVLSRRGFHPPGMIFPVSAAIFDDIDGYRRALNEYSSRVLSLIGWRPTERGNVRVLDETANYYRYFDATPQAEFLYRCVRKTVEQDLPQETAFLQRYDEFSRRVQLLVDMPDNTVDLLFRFLEQNEGRLSRRARTGEFAQLEDDEVTAVEAIYAEAFGQE